MDTLHHIAIQVTEIEATISWYQTIFDFSIEYQDQTWALLKFENISIALVLAEQHPPHLAFYKEDADRYGPLTPHRDGTESVYLSDPSGNFVEILRNGVKK